MKAEEKKKKEAEKKAKLEEEGKTQPAKGAGKGKKNVEEEIVKLEEELKYTQGFLVGVTKKLSNERFVANAPDAVVASERKKQADAEGKIVLIMQKNV